MTGVQTCALPICIDRRHFGIAALAAAGVLTAPPLFAQGKYPSRPIKLIVPSPPGGGPDIVGRLVAQHLTQRWGQQVLIDNIGGASGQLGILGVTKAVPDGYTLAFSAPTPITIGDNFEPKPPYNAQRDLVGAALIGRNPALIVINSSVKANTLREFTKALCGDDRGAYLDQGIRLFHRSGAQCRRHRIWSFGSELCLHNWNRCAGNFDLCDSSVCVCTINITLYQ